VGVGHLRQKQPSTNTVTPAEYQVSAVTHPGQREMVDPVPQICAVNAAPLGDFRGSVAAFETAADTTYPATT